MRNIVSHEIIHCFLCKTNASLMYSHIRTYVTSFNWQKVHCLHTMLKHRFHKHSKAMYINIRTLTVTAESSSLAFSVIAFSALSDVQSHLCSLQLALAASDREQLDCNSPHNYLLMLSIDLATLHICGIWSTIRPHLRSFRNVSL